MSGILRLSASASGPTRSVPYCTAPRSGSRRRRCRRGGGRRTGRPHPRSHRRRRAKGSQISRCGESSSTPLTGAPWWVFWTSGLEKFSGAPWIGRRQDLPGQDCGHHATVRKWPRQRAMRPGSAPAAGSAGAPTPRTHRRRIPCCPSGRLRRPAGSPRPGHPRRAARLRPWGRERHAKAF